MNITEFETLLGSQESTTLDFKKTQYNIINDSGGLKTAEFVKDIVCFSNTIRTESAHIVIGIKANEDGSKEFAGLDFNIDDATFQEKVKNKVSPIPIFLYQTIEYKGKLFGIIEIPVRKYIEPISPIIKLKGLEPGKIYFRRGTSNSDANFREIILINKWLESLPDEIVSTSYNEEISHLMQMLTSRSELLSVCTTKMLQFANKYSILELRELCNNELSGWFDKFDIGERSNKLSYRTVNLVVSPHLFDINVFWGDSNQMINEIKMQNDSFVSNYVFQEPLSTIEQYLDRINEKPNTTLLTLGVGGITNQVDKQEKMKGLQVYANRDNLNNIYNGIRQKLINTLIGII